MNNRIAILIMVIALSIPFALGEVYFDRNMPSPVEVNHNVTITIKASSTKPIDAFDVVEFIPYGWKISDWSVENYNKNAVVLETLPEYTYQGKVRTAYHWSFRDGLDNEKVTLTYTLTAKDVGSKEFITVWTYPGGFKTNTTMLSVIPGKGIVFCGNGVCELGENSQNCPQDCLPVKVEVKQIDIMPILIIIALGIATALIVYAAKKRIMRAAKARTTIEDLRTFIKLGLVRGYMLRELVNALIAGGIDESIINEIIKDKEIQKLQKGNKKKIPPEAKVLEEIKRYVRNLKAGDLDDIYKELGIRKLR
jgi:hypothetical protein